MSTLKTIKTRPDDSGCEHADGPTQTLNGMLVWTCPLCHHNLTRTTSNIGTLSGLTSIVEGADFC